MAWSRIREIGMFMPPSLSVTDVSVMELSFDSSQPAEQFTTPLHGINCLSTENSHFFSELGDTRDGHYSCATVLVEALDVHGRVAERPAVLLFFEREPPEASSSSGASGRGCEYLYRACWMS
jgi:hypothetical protein